MSKKKLAKVFYADLWGSREKKYEYLLRNDVKTTKWKELNPLEPYYFLVPKDFALEEEYKKFWKITEIFSKYRNGVTTGQDQFFTDLNKQTLKARILAIFNRSLTNDYLADIFRLKSQAGRKLLSGRQYSKYDESLLKPYAYRPFDKRWIYAENRFLWRSVEWLWKQFEKENIALVSTRILSTQHFLHVFISDMVGDYCYLSNKTKEFAIFFPLYLYPDQPKGALIGEEKGSQRIPNFTPQFLQTLKDSIKKEPAPEEIFFYIYAILYSPTYRKRYEEFLKIDFPRVPLPSNYELFKKLIDIGKELVELHLLKHSSLSQTDVGFPKGGSNIVENVKFQEKSRRVYINKEQYFEGVEKEIWEYKIGAYQVMEKYLKDRKGRKLTIEEINHYMKIHKAISLTVKLQEKIAHICKEHRLFT